MDLSAIIFVVLALAWAVYLIPKALKHHDEMASDRLVHGHSDKVRILSRKSRTAVADVAEAVTTAAPRTTYDAASDPGYPTARKAPALEADPVSAPVLTRATARKAAQRRRRVLGLLVLSLAVVWGLTWFAYLPIWAPGVPGALVFVWLVIARLSVRKQQRRRRRARSAGSMADRRASSVVEEGRQASSVVEEGRQATSVVEEGRQARLETTTTVPTAEEFLDELADEDTTGLAREEIEAALADDGSLWDPLPMTLPTYVNKARARRTVRTIELTGINSSGHDETDSALAREASESAQAAEESAARRKVAGA